MKRCDSDISVVDFDNLGCYLYAFIFSYLKDIVHVYIYGQSNICTSEECICGESVANLPVCGQGCQSGALLSSVVVVEIRIWDDRERRKVNEKAI